MHMFKAKTLTMVDILFIQKVIAVYMSNVYMCSLFGHRISYTYVLAMKTLARCIIMYFTKPKKTLYRVIRW